MKKVLVLILAYNAEKHIVKVLNRLPESLWHNPEYATEVVVIDDCSKDDTSRVARAHFNNCPYPIRLLRNAVNQGYGGNQKVGYTYAIENGYDAVVMLHGDGQYPPEMIPDVVAPLVRGEADAVFGSRMMRKEDALKGGMPKYKFVGNIVLTVAQNAMMRSHLTEFHSGFRAYTTAALKRIPFQYNSDVFDFDTDIIIQFMDNQLTIKEIPIPTHYGDEVCHVNGLRYAWDIMISTFVSRVQKLGIFYDPKFDYERSVTYRDKSAFASSHSFAAAQSTSGETVLDIGSECYFVAARLREKGCKVTCCDWQVDERVRAHYDEGIAMDLNHPDFSVLKDRRFDVIQLLDILEQMESPERFLAALYSWCADHKTRIVITTTNIAFFIQRIMLLLGQFNYNKRGTLDMQHRRLFTFAALKRTLGGAGFAVVSTEGIPAPFPLAFGDTPRARRLLKLNEWLIHLGKGLFSYQIAVIAKPRPTLQSLVQAAIAYGAEVK